MMKSLTLAYGWQTKLALLAKQVWCLVHSDGSLAFKVPKAKYFLNYAILDAILGCQSSLPGGAFIGLFG